MVAPSLDALANDPTLAQGLPADVLVDLFRAVGRLHAELHAAILLAQTPPAPPGSDLDEPIGVKAAAARLGLALSTLYQKAKRDPVYRALLVDNGTRKKLFSPRRIDAFLRGRGRVDGPSRIR